MQQPVQDFGGTFGLVSEDAVNQQGCGNEREGRCPRRSGSLPAARAARRHTWAEGALSSGLSRVLQPRETEKPQRKQGSAGPSGQGSPGTAPPTATFLSGVLRPGCVLA